MNKIPEGTQYIESGCGEKGFRKYEKGCWWFFEGHWRHVDWKMGDLIPVSEHPFYVSGQDPWNGEDLPPVEAACEYTLNSGISWFTCVISYIYMDKSALIAKCFTSERSPEFIEQEIPLDDLRRVQFRPIRTAEQIAVDERLHKVRNALTAIKASRHFPGDEARQNVMVATVEAMIDAGFVKQVAP